MTVQRVDEIERKVIYMSLQYLEDISGRCDDSKVVFHVGRIFGQMQLKLRNELEKEIDVPDNNVGEIK